MYAVAPKTTKGTMNLPFRTNIASVIQMALPTLLLEESSRKPQFPVPRNFARLPRVFKGSLIFPDACLSPCAVEAQNMNELFNFLDRLLPNSKLLILSDSVIQGALTTECYHFSIALHIGLAFLASPQ